MKDISLDTQIPDAVLSWVKALPVQEHSADMTNMVEEFGERLASGTFVNGAAVADIASNLVANEFKKGGHTKLLSKKFLAKVDGKVLSKHFPLKQSAVYTEIQASHRKRVGFTFTIINYFKTDKGYIYFCRNGIPYPVLFIFTGHFFDRVLQRSLGNDDHGARMTAVFRLMRLMDKKFYQEGLTLMATKSDHAFMSAMGGLCLGAYKAYENLPDIYGFTGGDGLDLPKSYTPRKPNHREVFFFLTFVNKEKLGPEQLHLYNSMLPKDGKFKV